MKAQVSNRLPREYDQGRMVELLRELENLLNSLAEERINAHYGARTSAPTTGFWKQGDFVRNSSPAEAGSGGSKYVVFGWICTASGEPGTWLPARVLTGN